MSDEIPRPFWAFDVEWGRLAVVAYTGPESDATRWKGRTTRRRFEIVDEAGNSITLSLNQAIAVAEMIQDEEERLFS